MSSCSMDQSQSTDQRRNRKGCEDVKGEPDADMIAKKKDRQEFVCRSRTKRRHTAPVVTPPKWRSRWTTARLRRRFTSSRIRQHVRHKKQITLVTPVHQAFRQVRHGTLTSLPTFWKSTQGGYLRQRTRHQLVVGQCRLLSKTIRSHGISLVDGCLGTRGWGGITVRNKHALSGGQTYSDYEFVVREV
jgi:hypothetical protein